ncbi:glycosyltransferase family 2 protein [bacterium]|nr:glycosyltransferase family 2 protein [bacterium]
MMKILTYSDDLPIVSLLVPMKNEEDYIGKCLDSMLTQTYPADKLEILIFDGNSTDRSVEVVEEYCERSEQFKQFNNPKEIQSAAWNMGIDLASGDIIGIVSAHSILDAEYVEHAVETLLRTKADLVGGPMRAIGESVLARTIAAATSTPFGVGDSRFHYTEEEVEVDSVYLGLCFKEVYERVGGFDESLVNNQDDEFSYRLRKAGGRIICNPKIKSLYFNRGSFSKLWKQYFRYGFWKVKVIRMHPGQISIRHFIPGALVGGIAGSALISLVSSKRYLFALASLPYLVANGVSSLILYKKNREFGFFRTALVYGTLHFAYGTGFIRGLYALVTGDKRICK